MSSRLRAYESVSDEKVTVSDEKVFKDTGAFVWAHDKVLKGHALGLYKGYSNRQFAPKDVAKRNQAAAVLHRLKNVLK